MNGAIELHTECLEVRIEELLLETTKMKDTISLMMEDTAVLQQKWRGQANINWTLQFHKELEAGMKFVKKLQKNAGAVWEMAICLADAEQKILTMIETC